MDKNISLCQLLWEGVIWWPWKPEFKDYVFNQICDKLSNECFAFCSLALFISWSLNQHLYCLPKNIFAYTANYQENAHYHQLIF